MTLDEAIELGRAWPSWEWARGQVYIAINRDRDFVDQRGVVFEGGGSPVNDQWEALPDFRDPGTRGHALEQVREALGDPRACVQFARAPGGIACWVVWRTLGGADVFAPVEVARGATEAAALLAARRAVAPPPPQR